MEEAEVEEEEPQIGTESLKYENITHKKLINVYSWVCFNPVLLIQFSIWVNYLPHVRCQKRAALELSH